MIFICSILMIGGAVISFLSLVFNIILEIETEGNFLISGLIWSHWSTILLFIGLGLIAFSFILAILGNIKKRGK